MYTLNETIQTVGKVNYNVDILPLMAIKKIMCLSPEIM